MDATAAVFASTTTASPLLAQVEEAEKTVVDSPVRQDAVEAIRPTAAIATDEAAVAPSPTDSAPLTPLPPRSAKEKTLSFQRGVSASFPKSGIDDDDDFASDDEDIVAGAREEFELKADKKILKSLRQMNDGCKGGSLRPDPALPRSEEMPSASGRSAQSGPIPNLAADPMAARGPEEGEGDALIVVDREASSLDLNPVEWPKPLLDNFADTDTYPDIAGSSDEANAQWVVGGQRLLARVVTWNLCAKSPPSDAAALDTLLAPGRFHLYVIGTEECERSIAQSALNPSKKKWESVLVNYFGDSYNPLCSHALQATHIMVFAHRSISELVRSVETVSVPTGAANTLGNKGCVAAHVVIGSTNIVFCNAHLAAHQHAYEERNNSFKHIMEEVPARFSRKVVQTSPSSSTMQGSSRGSVSSVAPAPTAAAAAAGEAGPDGTGEGIASGSSRLSPATSSFATTSDRKIIDRLVFAGDLNYRIRGNVDMVMSLLELRMQEVLASNDQLNIARASLDVFAGFEEGPLHFLPTYKLRLQSDEYDRAKARTPSWTDRVLFRPNGMRLLAYNSDTSLNVSDHRPVYASFAIDVCVSADDSVAGTQSSSKSNSAPQLRQFKSQSEVCSVQ